MQIEKKKNMGSVKNYYLNALLKVSFSLITFFLININIFLGYYAYQLLATQPDFQFQNCQIEKSI